MPTAAVTALRASLSKHGALLKADSALVFVCGARADAENPTARQALMTYARKHLNDYHFFMAEDVLDENIGTNDLLTLEERLADFSDCVIVILESPGTFAELGAFSSHDTLVKLLLVVNDCHHRGSQSFISRGPITKINRVSRFKPVVNARLDSILSAVPEMEARLLRIRRKHGRRINLSSMTNFASCPRKHRLLFLADLISLFGPLDFKGIREVLESLYSSSPPMIGLELRMLRAIGLLEQHGSYYWRSPVPGGLYFTYLGCSPVAIRARTVNHVHKYCPARTALMSQRIRGVGEPR